MKRHLLLIMIALLPIVASADEYTDPQSKVVYTYEPGQPTASVKAGYDEVVEPDYGSELMTDHYAGSPDASGDVVILDRFTVGTAEYVVTSIGEVAFRRNENIKSVSIPETVTTIGDYAFQNCDSLTSVQLPDGLTQIASGLFEGCEQLTSVAIPSSVITIGERAFDECSSLSSLTLPAGLTFIGSFAFNGTPWYNAQYNEAPDGLFYIGPQLVGYKGDKPTGNLTIKEGTTCVANSAFCNCTGLTSVTFPKTVTFVDTYAFENCTGLKAVHITDLAAWSSIEFQWSRIGSSNPLCYAYDLYLNGEKVSDIVIPEGVTRIGSHAFDHCGPLTSVVIPEGVTSIGENAFRSCISLTSVTIPSSMARIESQAFLWCKKLDAVHISDLAAWCRISLSDRTSNPLYYNARLYLKGDEVTDLVIPDGITLIGDYAFTQCPSLASVTIPEGVTSIGNHAFRNCSNLSSITIPEGVTSIGEYVFDGCSGFTSISLPKSLSSIGHCAFAHCVGLSSITIPEGVTSIGDFVFDGCSGLTSITIPTSLTDISHGTFNECTNLTSVTIPKSVTSVSGFAFGSCSNLADIYCYAEDVPTTEDRVFYGTPIASATLHVPAGSIDKYKATSPWNEFGNILALSDESHQPLPFLEGNPIWVYKYEHMPIPRDPNLHCWVDTGERSFTYYFLGKQKEIDGKVYIMMGVVRSKGENELTVNRWLPVREENGVVYTITDSLPGVVEHIYNEDFEIPYLQQGNECVLYNFSAKIGEKLHPQTEISTVESYGTYQLMDGTVCGVLKTSWEYLDLYEKLGYVNVDTDYGLIDPLIGMIIPTNGHVYVKCLNAYYQDDMMLYKAPDAQEGLCVNDTIWTREDAGAYASSYKADPRQEEVFSYIRQLQTATTGDVTIDGLNYYLYSTSHEATLKGGTWTGELDIPAEVSYNGQAYTVKDIVYSAFRNCKDLTKVRIPKTIEKVLNYYPTDDEINGMVSPDHMNPFMGCTALESIEVDEENPSLKSVDGVLFSQDGKGYYYYLTNSYYGTGLYCYPAGAQRESYTIPDGVEWIGSGAFEHNQYISTLTIPSSMKMIYYSVFSGCSNLKNVYCYAEDVPIAFSEAFKGFPVSSATLHVPAGSVDKYKAASPWSEFGSIVAIEPQNGAFLSEGMAWVDGFGYEQDGHYKTDDVKLFYYITVGDTLIDDKSYFRIQRIKTCKTKTYEESKYEVFDDNLCFFMREDDAGDVWFYAKDRDVFYRLSGNTLYDYLADGLVGRDLFLFNAKKKYAVGDKVPLGMSALEDPNGFQEGEDYWHIYSLDVEDVSERNLLDGKTYPIYNNYFLESIGPLDGPLSGIGSPNSYSLDFRQLFAFYRNGQMIYRNEGYIAALEDFFPNILDIITGSSPAEIVTFTENQMATIILPTEPDAGKGKYYRLDRCEDGQIIFEQELHPQAHIPYIIVPSEDFSIDPSTLDLAGLSNDTVSVGGISFIGSYTSNELNEPEGFYLDIIDTTPDCGFSPSEGTGKKAYVGALRAYLQVSWDEPYNHGGSKAPGEKLEIKLKDYGTGITEPSRPTPDPSLYGGEVYDLQGRKIGSGKSFPLKGVRGSGIYIEGGKKKVK